MITKRKGQEDLVWEFSDVEKRWIRNKVKWAKSWRLRHHDRCCNDCGKVTTCYRQDKDDVCKDCLLNRAFGEATK